MNHESFPRYLDCEPRIPVWDLTPDRPRCIHRFFDTSSISPSGRYLALFQLPFDDRQSELGEPVRVCIVDLDGGTIRDVAETCGWEPQMGANINWGNCPPRRFEKMWNLANNSPPKFEIHSHQNSLLTFRTFVLN